MTLTRLEIDDLREQRRALALESDAAAPDVVVIDGPLSGSRTFTPADVAASVTVVYVHGGGWVAGDLDTHAGICGRLATALCAKVVAIDFRRPPEDRWPRAVDDVVEALDRLAELGPLALAGDATGGHIAIEAAARTTHPLRALILLQPVVDPALATPSWRTQGDGRLPRERMEQFWATYFGEAARVGVEDLPLRRLPSTAIVVSARDPLVDEGRALAARLTSASVPCRLLEMGEFPHGALNLVRDFPGAQRVLAELATWFRTLP